MRAIDVVGIRGCCAWGREVFDRDAVRPGSSCGADLLGLFEEVGAVNRNLARSWRLSGLDTGADMDKIDRALKRSSARAGEHRAENRREAVLSWAVSNMSGSPASSAPAGNLGGAIEHVGFVEDELPGRRPVGPAESQRGVGAGALGIQAFARLLIFEPSVKVWGRTSGPPEPRISRARRNWRRATRWWRARRNRRWDIEQRRDSVTEGGRMRRPDHAGKRGGRRRRSMNAYNRVGHLGHAAAQRRRSTRGHPASYSCSAQKSVTQQRRGQ